MLKECILHVNSNYLNDTVEWEILGIDLDTNKTIFKEHRSYDKLTNCKFLPFLDMVSMVSNNNTIGSLACIKGYYWKKVYVNGKLLTDNIRHHIFSSKYYPIEFFSFEEYVKYLKEK